MDTATEVMDTTTARKLPRRPATTTQLSPLSPPPSLSPTLSQSRPVSTSQSAFQESAARTSPRRNASLSQRSRLSPSLLTSVSLVLVPLTARLLSSPSPSRCARRSTTDTPSRLSPPMPQSPLMPQSQPTTLKQLDN